MDLIDVERNSAVVSLTPCEPEVRFDREIFFTLDLIMTRYIVKLFRDCYYKFVYRYKYI
jgi:hypothetical protein